VLNGKKAPPADAYQTKLQLFTANGAAPTVRYLSVATSTAAQTPSALEPASGIADNTLLAVPEHSQMVYPDGGNVWCSPTSTSMVLAYWNGNPGTIESRVRSTVTGVYDRIYDGHGNWPFNTAFAATEGMEAKVARFTSMNDVEEWVAAGVPVIFSFAWKKGAITGSAVASSDGHLAVIVGFDGAGNPIVNDPAAPANEDVQRTYDRAELETVMLQSSGATVYLIHPPGHPVPEL
jgi:Peptidase_C39 like family